jgi:amino acid transporter
MSEPTLKRSIGLWQMMLYGTGSMLGAGIYGLIGKAAGEMGSAVWLAFLVSLVAALFTGLSYASLGSRYPRAAGSAYVVQRAYRHKLLTYAAGLAVAASGITSMAAGARVIGENLQRIPFLTEIPVTALSIVFLLILAAIIYRGIRESMWANVICSLVEAGGLLFVIATGLSYWGSANLLETPQGAGFEGLSFVLLMQGAALTFYSFLGFEDSLNVAEEMKNPQVTLPIGLMLALTMTALLYIGVAVTAVSVVPWRELAIAPAPLAHVVATTAPWFPNWMFLVITIFAVANTALINYVTTSRLLYGMARDRHLPKPLAAIHAQRRTPHRAIVLILALLILLVSIGDISHLAASTVLLLLAVFSVVNIALVVLKRRTGEQKGSFEIPSVIPMLGAMVCLALLIARATTGDWRATAIAGALLLGSILLFAIMRPDAVAED